MEFPSGSAGEGSGTVAAVAGVRSLARELPHAMGSDKKKKKGLPMESEMLG